MVVCVSNDLNQAIAERKTFAIISHPDAGKTTLTEQLLLFGGAIQLAGTIKGRKASRHAASDWMEIEKQRGISVTTSVMQFPYKHHLINLLDTPGHSDFSEDTYRTLTAVDSALMVIDAAKGVESRTVKLMEVCRLRKTPIMTFINKLDRDARSPIELLDEIEDILKIHCVPITWPIGMGKYFKGIYHLLEDVIYVYRPAKKVDIKQPDVGIPVSLPEGKLLLRGLDESFHEEMALIKGVHEGFKEQDYLNGDVTPVCFGSAINHFGIHPLLDFFIQHAPSPGSRDTNKRVVQPNEAQFSGFVFKIQANMDIAHRDRIAFLRIASGQYKKGMRVYHERLGKTIQLNSVLTFVAGKREHTDQAYPGDVIGIHNHGTIQIGDTFTEGESFKFIGIPNFAPELFRSVRLANPLKQKALLKGLIQLSEEGATQFFRMMDGNELILGAVGRLQFDVVAHRLKIEYGVDCIYDATAVVAARWVVCENAALLIKFKREQRRYLAYDQNDYLMYLFPSKAKLNIVVEKWSGIQFHAIREH